MVSCNRNNSEKVCLPFYYSFGYAKWLMTLETLFLVTLALVILFGNTMTILAIWKTEKLRTTTNKFVICLASSDLLVGVIIAISLLFTEPEISKHINETSWNLAWVVLVTFSVDASADCIFLIALERYVFIIHPLRYHAFMSSYKTQLGIAALFTWTLLFSLSIIWKNGCTHDVPCSYYSIISRQTSITWVVFFATLYTCLVVFYGSIAKAAISQRKRIRVVNDIRMSIRSSDLRLAKLMFSVMGVFSICFLPAGVVALTDIVCDTHYSASTGIYTGSIALLNSGMNFFIYVINDRDFRLAIKRILCCR